MKALYYDGTKAVYREDLPVPVYCEGHSLIKILIALCRPFQNSLISNLRTLDIRPAQSYRTVEANSFTILRSSIENR